MVNRFKDGSRLVRVPVRPKGRRHVVASWLERREIRVRVQRPGHRAQELRLWTSLLDPKSAPARELIELYARRWEHELYYRELKRQLRKSEVLQSHTVETGAQEIAAAVLASALRVSFVKTLELMRRRAGEHRDPLSWGEEIPRRWDEARRSWERFSWGGPGF